MTLDDKIYLDRFRARDLGPEHFDHRGHLRMAWLHLCRYDLEEASARVCTGIGELAAQFGAPEKFNHTLSEALLRIMAQRMRESPVESFEQFLQSNPDLLSDCRAVLARHYSEQRLHCAAAREGWVEPDLMPLAR